MTLPAAAAVWLAILALAVPYVGRAKHPQTRPFAAYLLFVSLFSMVAAALYVALASLAAAAGLGDALSSVPGAGLFLALIFVPAFLVARWQLKRPPRRVEAP